MHRHVFLRPIIRYYSVCLKICGVLGIDVNEQFSLLFWKLLFGHTRENFARCSLFLFGQLSKKYLSSNFCLLCSYGLLFMDTPMLADQQNLTSTSFVQKQNVINRTRQEWWLLGLDIRENQRNFMLLILLDDNDLVFAFTNDTLKIKPITSKESIYFHYQSILIIMHLQKSY